MRISRNIRNSRRGVTLVELLVALVISTIILMGMGMVLVTLFTGMRESRDFFEATSRVDLIRQLSFDARTGNSIRFPTANGAPGNYAAGGFVGDQIQFDSLRFTPPNTTDTVTITWESRRPTAAPITDPYTVFRFIDETPEYPNNIPGDDVFTFAQENITFFEVVRQSADAFTVSLESAQGNERVQVDLAVTLRNVIQ